MLEGWLVFFRLYFSKSNIVPFHCLLLINQKQAIYATKQETMETIETGDFDQRHKATI